jgi:hypothetical protein
MPPPKGTPSPINTQLVAPIVSAVNSDNISLTISNPEEGGVFYSDAIGTPTYLYLDSYSPNGIHEVTISNGVNKSSCQNRSGNLFVCENPWQGGLNSVTIIAIDNFGESISRTRNYTVVVGLQPPPIRSQTPHKTPTPGFGFSIGIIALFIGFSSILIKKW